MTEKIIVLLMTIQMLITGIAAKQDQKLQPPTGTEIKGEVKDQQGAVIVGAKVVLEDSQKKTKETATDDHGRFAFHGVPAGSCIIRTIADGFAPHEEQIKIDTPGPHPQVTITMFPEIKETVSVNDDTSTVTVDPEHASGTQIIKEKDIKELPDDPDEFANRLQLMAAMGGGMPGGATVTVDGFIVHGRLPSKGSIREIRINPDLYSAEYDKPPYKGGRIEIFTKPGAESFHGSGFLNFNDSALNARNAFAVTKPPTDTRRYGFEMGGPIISKKSGYFINVERREIDEASTINAVVLDNDFRPVSISQNVLSPMRLTIGSARFDWQTSKSNTFTARYDFNENRLQNQGIGGFSLSDHGFNTNTLEHALRFSDTTVIGTTMVNEARVGITYIHVGESALSQAPAILVPGAFSSGGAIAQSQLSNDLHVEIDDVLSTIAGKHKLKFGGQILGKLSGDTRADNFNGTFIFGGGLAPQLDSNNLVVSNAGVPVLVSISGLEEYRRTLLGLPGGTPTQFSITSGNPAIHVNQWQFSAFVEDDWKLHPNLTLSMGLRYEGQTNPTDKLSLAPRFGVAYAVDKKQHWIIRGHIGVFYSRIPDALDFDVLRLNGQREQQIIINNPSFPNPFGTGSISATVPTVRELQPGITPEASLQGQIAIEHQFPHGLALYFNESYSKGWNVLRSININAPVLNATADPLTAPRPLGINENILQYQSNGETSGPVTFIGIKQSDNKHFNVFAGYLYFHLLSNADTPQTMPQSSFSQIGEFVRPLWQSAHRAFVAGTVVLPWKLRVSPALHLASGTPFNITTGIDNNGDGNFTDRPSIVNGGSVGTILTPFGSLSPFVINGTLPRNFGTNPPTITLDLDVSRDFSILRRLSKDERYKLTVNVRSSNLLNHVNVTGLNGVLTSPFFDKANSADPARRIEFGARFSF